MVKWATLIVGAETLTSVFAFLLVGTWLIDLLEISPWMAGRHVEHIKRSR